MPAEEREKRHQHNFEHVSSHTAQQWAEFFVRCVKEITVIMIILYFCISHKFLSLSFILDELKSKDFTWNDAVLTFLINKGRTKNGKLVIENRA